jgi:hypothetical protein
MKIHLVVINITLLLAACTPTHISDPASPSEPSLPSSLYSTPQGDIHTMTPTPSTPSDINLQILIDKAKEDLTRRLSISAAQIDLVEAADVMWSDSSLGCPQKGMVYADVLTPGYLIVLSVNSEEYEYHTSKGTEMVYCENPNPPVPGMPGDT